MYKVDGRARRMTLGEYPTVGLADADVLRAEAKKLLERNVDPGAKAQAEKKAEAEAETVSQLIDLYLEEWARPRKRSAKEDERILNKDVRPEWGKRKAKEIKRRDIKDLLKKIKKRGAGVQANRTLAVVRKMFTFAVEEEIVDASPAVKIERPHRESQRDRVLNPNEIRIFWAGLERSQMTNAIQIALKLQLATAQRKGEVIGAAKDEFDLIEEQVWTIPAERSKNRKAHEVPLSPMALSLLKDAFDLAGESHWLFPSPNGRSHVNPQAVDHAIRRALKPTKKKDEELPPALPLDHLTPHDLRRTAATEITGLGIPRLVVAKVLNHTDRGVTSAYDRHSYAKEKRRALDAWAARLQEILEDRPADSNVVAMTRVVDSG